MRWLLWNKVFCWRQNTGAYKSETGTWVRYGFPGSPDIIGMTKSGKWLGIEAKTGKGKLNENQIKFMQQVIENNGVYIVARSVHDLEAMKAVILGE